MRKLLATLFLLAMAFGVEAATRISLTVTVTNTPVTSNTITINGVTRYWTNSTASGTIATNLTSKNAAATNLFNAYATFTVGSGIVHRWLDTNQIQFTAPLGVALSGSSAGNWATTSLSTQSGPSTFTALWPMENMVGETNRTNQGSSLVYGLGIYSTNAFPTNATALTNFITKGAAVGPQYITSELRLSGNLNNGTGRLSLSNAVNYGLAFRSEGTGGNSFQVGSNAQAVGNLSMAAGNGAIAGSANSMAVGNSALATNINTTAVGYGAQATAQYATAVGTGSQATTENAIALGEGVVTSGNRGIGIGDSDTQATGYGDVAIGTASVASGGKSVAIGVLASATYTNSTALGYGATATTTNQIRLGTSADTVSIPGVLTVEGTQTNTTFTGTNQWLGDIATPPLTDTSVAAGNNVINATNRILRVTGTPGAAWTIVGITSGRDGRLFTVYNDTGYALTIANESGVSATAANRIRTMAGADYVSGTNSVIQFFYDANRSRWIMISANP